MLSGAQLDLLDRYAEILVDYNQKVNLTAITSPEGIEDRHFADSLLFAAQPEVTGKLVDVGTGAGFPGVVAKIFKPDLQLTLMEPTGKRVEFLKYACAQLGLTGVEFAKERAEEAARKVWREQFDLASARAVAALPMLAEYCLPLDFFRLFYPDFRLVPGVRFRGNCYKCGDRTEHPHYLAWNPVNTLPPTSTAPLFSKRGL